MCIGTPMVASDTGGIRTLFSTNKLKKYLVNPHSLNAFYKTSLGILNMTTEDKKRLSNDLKSQSELFSSAVMAEQYKKVYDHVISQYKNKK